jgi:hypothetical protein
MSGLSYAAHAEARRETLLDNAARHRQRRAARASRGGRASRAARALRTIADRLEHRATPVGPGRGCDVRISPLHR